MPFCKEDKGLIRDILKTPYPQLFKEIKDRDYKDKKEILAQIDTFKALYRKTEDIKAKEIVNFLIKDLKEANGRIERNRNKNA